MGLSFSISCLTRRSGIPPHDGCLCTSALSSVEIPCGDPLVRSDPSAAPGMDWSGCSGMRGRLHHTDLPFNSPFIPALLHNRVSSHIVPCIGASSSFGRGTSSPGTSLCFLKPPNARAGHGGSALCCDALGVCSMLQIRVCWADGMCLSWGAGWALSVHTGLLSTPRSKP